MFPKLGLGDPCPNKINLTRAKSNINVYFYSNIFPLQFFHFFFGSPTLSCRVRRPIERKSLHMRCNQRHLNSYFNYSFFTKIKREKRVLLKSNPKRN